jgi:hypothetical protein
MSQIVVYKIYGLSPLLCNNPASMARAAEGIAISKIPTPAAEAAAKVYKDEDGTFYILSEAFRSSIVGKGGGASGRKLGKFTAISRVCAGVFTVEPRATLLDAAKMKPIKEYTIDTRRAVVQQQGVLRSRPMFSNWSVRLPLEVDPDFVDPVILLELLNISGKVSGVGDFRPQRKGTFGRYRAEIETK